MSRTAAACAAFTAVCAGLAVAAPPAHAAGIRVSQTTGLAPAGQSVTVTGSGFDPKRNNRFGVYVVFGPRRADFFKNADAFGSAVWVHPGGGGGQQAPMSASGSFTVTLRVQARYTDGDGRKVDCLATRCYVMTMAAHGVPDRSQDTSAALTFKGGGTQGSGSGGAGSGTGGSGGTGSGTSGAGTGTGTGTSGAGGTVAGASGATASPGTSATAPPSGGAAQPASGGAAVPVATQTFVQTATGPTARSPWLFWLLTAAVLAAIYGVHRYARRRHL
ncbi:hypothetical protein [Spirillospora sp. NPDC047279]|uniref:hypothetical protein n=1 Tax=Spirillospora sp. NPDC047279 TaxID=3155478 RepID=UPI003408B2B7